MNIEIWKRFIYKRDEFFNNADKKNDTTNKLVWELIKEDNTSLTLFSEVEKLLQKRNLLHHLKKIKQCKSKAQMLQRKKYPRKENSKSHMQKRKNKTVVLRSHKEENLHQKLKWKIPWDRKTLPWIHQFLWVMKISFCW